MSESERPSSRSAATSVSWPELADFSLVLGGPLYQLLRKARLEEDVEDHLLRRTIIISGVLWLPLLSLCLVQGTLLTGLPVPFVRDVETHVRFLVAVPLLIFAELIVHRRLRMVVVQFIHRGLVPEAAFERFKAAILSAMRLRNSIAAELALVAVIFPLAYYVRAHYLALNSSTWYARIEDGRTEATLAGMWYWWVANPIFQFLLVRWYYRLFIWARLLWHVSRIDLALIPTHPDRHGGLGFLSASAFALSPLLTAHGAAVAGFLANRILLEGASLTSFQLEILLLVGFLLVVVVGPLCVFAPKVHNAKRNGLWDYGILAAEYTREFDRRWVHGARRDADALLGSADIQSLADLGNAFTVIKETRGIPVNRDTLVQLVLATLLPFAPLLLTLMPLEELLNRIIGALF